ncbi:hypothetical protein [Leptolyngbya ohadii]|uniref:hypothetical protein n=1 Tax=Leptolyngbya ohadii TaxID=1962290 RepID=UPI000B5992E9|nr:hypothetical protein [Leptolyngbya ohadii]
MASQSVVNRLLTVSLFVGSSFGTLALFGAVPMLPQLTARLAGILPDLSEMASEPSQPPVNRQGRGSWVAQLPDNTPDDQPLPHEFRRRSAEFQRYRLPR